MLQGGGPLDVVGVQEVGAVVGVVDDVAQPQRQRGEEEPQVLVDVGLDQRVIRLGVAHCKKHPLCYALTHTTGCDSGGT